MDTEEKEYLWVGAEEEVYQQVDAKEDYQLADNWEEETSGWAQRITTNSSLMPRMMTSV